MIGTSNYADVSVIVPCYRCKKSIERAVESIVDQSVQPGEVILVEDYSDDGTLEVLHRLRNKYGDWLKIIQLPMNSGVAAARNAGWNAALHSHVAFLDADDAWHPRKLEIQYQYMRDHPEVVLCGHAHRFVKDDNAIPNWTVADAPVAKPVSKLHMLISNRFITPSVMVKRDIPFRFAEGKRYMEDHLLWMQVACAGFPVVKISSELAAIYKFPYGMGGLSGQYRDMHAAELDNYRQLGDEGQISTVAMLFLTGLARLKYLKRRIVVSLLRADFE
jgi:glycosyltransferase involved in cell wall biosynthesis